MTEFTMFTLLLGNKKLSLHKTHTVQLILRNKSLANESFVDRCEAVAITSLVHRERKYKPTIRCESHVGTEHYDTYENTLRGTTDELLFQAKVRESVYIPVLVTEINSKATQYIIM